MLQIRQIKHLAKMVGATEGELFEVAEAPDRFQQELILFDPAKPDKPRDVLNIIGALRRIQTRLLQRVLLPKLWPSEFSHGGVRGRHIKSNVQPHLASRFVFTTDIANFYPTISRNRVYDLFVHDFGCSPDVARICTKLCTYRHHLALGLVTSPILADRVLMTVDKRVAGACHLSGLVYTRFVDDLAISGPFDLGESGFPELVERILADHGLIVNPDKHQFGRLSDGITITKLRIVNGHPDVRQEYVLELERQLDDAVCLAAGKVFRGPYYTGAQIGGRVRFVAWVNPGRRRKLLSRYRLIDWERVEQAARELGFVAAKKTLTPRNKAAIAERCTDVASG